MKLSIGNIKNQILKLQKINKYKILLFPETQVEEKEYSDNPEIEPILKETKIFEETLKRDCKSFNLKTFYKNIQELTLKNISYEEFKKINYTSEYDVVYNQLLINPYCDVNDYIYHELFHVSNTKSKNNKYITGFDQVSDNEEIGMGLNEVYTDILADRYFEGNNGGYIGLSFLVKPLEMIIGKEKMEELYSKSDLLGLINEMNKYITAKEVIKYIKNLDCLVNDMQNDKVEHSKIIETSKKINEFLVNGILNKYAITNDSEELYNELNSIKSELSFNYEEECILTRKTKKLIKHYGYEVN